LGDTGFVFIRRAQIFDPFPDQSDWVIFLCAYGEFDSFNFLIFEFHGVLLGLNEGNGIKNGGLW
jgi:hypothetical protein